MGKEETLRQIKVAEADSRRAKEAALEEREGILRKAREEALAVQDSARRTAEERQAAIIEAAESETRREAEAILEQGKVGSGVLRREGEQNLERAVEFVVSKFKGARNA
jgi:V/A-type H+/Na+-transporting ATPase subunit G/H